MCHFKGKCGFCGGRRQYCHIFQLALGLHELRSQSFLAWLPEVKAKVDSLRGRQSLKLARRYGCVFRPHCCKRCTDYVGTMVFKSSSIGKALGPAVECLGCHEGLQRVSRGCHRGEADTKPSITRHPWMKIRGYAGEEVNFTDCA